MAKTPFVLRALSLLGQEEIFKLSEVLLQQQVPLKMAAGGEDLLAWNDSSAQKRNRPREDARVLDFAKKKSVIDFEETGDPNRPQPAEIGGPDGPSLIRPDLLLWQREMSKDSGGALKKVDAVKGYQKSTQMYVVKTETAEGKQKRHFASTDGVLVNKKQS